MRLFKHLSIMLVSLFVFTFPNCTCDVETISAATPSFILVNPGEIDFGLVAIDSFASSKFTILNKGQRPLSVEGFVLDPFDAPFAAERSLFNIEGESSVDVVIQFRPTTAGAFEALLTVQHDARNNDTPHTILLKGSASADVICTTCGGKNSECDQDTLVSYESVGGCEEDQCLYEATRTFCECGCNIEEAVCTPCQDAGTPVLTERDAGSEPMSETDAGQTTITIEDAGIEQPEMLDSGTPAEPPIASEDFRAVIAANIERTCGITVTGQVKCWGKCDIAPTCPDDGMWGNNSGEPPADMQPMDLGFNTPVASIKWSGFTYCILTTNNYAKCWGTNTGSLGFPSENAVVGGSPEDMGASLPYLNVGSGLTIRKLDLGFNHGCALLTNGKVKCWGAKSFLGLGLSGSLLDQLGDDPDEMGNNLPFVDLGNHGFRVVDIALAGEDSCALFEHGQVKCWGRNSAGVLGIGEPATVLGMSNTRGDAPDEMGDNLPFVELGENVFATQLTLGVAHACILTLDQRVKCWGANNDWGFLGQGHNNENVGTDPSHMGNNLPYTDLGTVGNVIALYSKGTHTCALFDIGKVKCWGDNWTGMLGYEDLEKRGSSPAHMGDNLPFIDLGTDFFVTGLTVGALSTCASSDTGAIKCWGSNPNGELGLGDTENRGDEYGEMGDNLPAIQID